MGLIHGEFPVKAGLGVHLYQPPVFLLGGGLSGVGEPLRASVAAALTGSTMEAFQPGPEIRLAALGEDVVPVGDLLLACAYHLSLRLVEFVALRRTRPRGAGGTKVV